MLAKQVAAELTGLRDGVSQGARLLYGGLPIHSLRPFTRPCIAGARKLLGRLAEATGVNATVLRRSDPALMQRLDCLATSVHDGVAASRGYWEELRAVLAAQHASRPAYVRVVCCSQCLHHAGRKLLVQAWQTRACDPSVGPDRAGMLLGVVSCERRDGITAAVTHVTEYECE